MYGGFRGALNSTLLMPRESLGQLKSVGDVFPVVTTCDWNQSQYWPVMYGKDFPFADKAVGETFEH